MLAKPPRPVRRILLSATTAVLGCTLLLSCAADPDQPNLDHVARQSLTTAQKGASASPWSLDLVPAASTARWTCSPDEGVAGPGTRLAIRRGGLKLTAADIRRTTGRFELDPPERPGAAPPPPGPSEPLVLHLLTLAATNPVLAVGETTEVRLEWAFGAAQRSFPRSAVAQLLRPEDNLFQLDGQVAVPVEDNTELKASLGGSCPEKTSPTLVLSFILRPPAGSSPAATQEPTATSGELPLQPMTGRPARTSPPLMGIPGMKADRPETPSVWPPVFLDPPPGVDAVEALLLEPDGAGTQAALKKLAPDPEDTLLYLAMDRKRKVKARQAAILLLGSSGGPEARMLLLDLLRTPKKNSAVITATLQGAGSFLQTRETLLVDDVLLRQAVEAMLSHPELAIVSAVVASLAEVGAARPALAQLELSRAHPELTNELRRILRP